MEKLKLTCTKDGNELGEFFTRPDAARAMRDYIEEVNEDVDPDDEEEVFTPFDFTLEIIESKDINEEVTDYATAREYLGGKPNLDYTVTQKVESRNALKLEDATRLVQALNPTHVQAIIALNELFTIAQAWNKADDFDPDFADRSQCKWFPWFVYDPKNAGFVSAYTLHAPSYTSAPVGSRLCFKTSERARQFGNQFIDLWNKVLLFQ